MNFLEELVAEWYEYQGYFVKRNIKVGKRAKGGYECELDVVAFHPEKKSLVHIEPSNDAHSWEKRVQRFRKKFDAGKKYIPHLFKGLDIPKNIEQIAIFGTAKTIPQNTIGGGRILLASKLLDEIFTELAPLKLMSKAIPEQWPLLRAFQFVTEYRESVIQALTKKPKRKKS